MTKEQISAERGRVLFWTLICQRNTLKKYENELRNYLLMQTKWEDVEAAEQDARFWRVSQEDLNEAKRKAHKSITDEEFLNAIS